MIKVSYQFVTISQGENKENQDYIYVRDNLYILLDGSTPLIKDCKDLGKFMYDFCKILEEKLGISHCLKKAISSTIVELSQIYKYKSTIESPVAVGSIVFVKDDKVELAVFGDVVALIEAKDYRKVLYDKRGVEIEEKNLDILMKLISEGKSYEEAVDIVMKKYIVKDRMNAGLSYSVITPFPDRSKNYIYFEEKVNNIRKIILASDGFWERALLFKLVENELNLLDYSFEDLLKLLIKIRELERNTKIIRAFKRHDDASILYIRFFDQ